MRLLPWLVSLFILLNALYAGGIQKEIVTGMFKSPKQAYFHNLKLDAYLGHDPEITRLYKARRYYFAVKYVDGTYRAVMTHFITPDDMYTVLQRTLVRYPKAYVAQRVESEIPEFSFGAAPLSHASYGSVTDTKPYPPSEGPDDGIVIYNQKAQVPSAAAAGTVSAALPADPSTVVTESTTIIPDETEALQQAEIVAVPTEPQEETPWLLYGIFITSVILGLLLIVAFINPKVHKSPEDEEESPAEASEDRHVPARETEAAAVEVEAVEPAEIPLVNEEEAPLTVQETEEAAVPAAKAGNRYLNTVDGLQVCGNDWAMYDEILDDFLRTYRHSGSAAETNFKDGEEAELAMLMHDVKGVAANIGARPLSKAAGDLHEALLTNQTASYGALVKAFAEQLQQTVAAIEAFRKEA